MAREFKITGKIPEDRRMLMFDFGLWALEKMVGHLPNDIKVEVKMVPLIDFDDGLRAWAENLDNKKKAPKRFKIVMPASSGNVAAVRRMAHELTHVKQWYMGEMRDDWDNETTTWKDGTVYDRSDTDPNAMSYWDWPWELEAHGREVGLVEQYIDARKYRGRCWWWDMYDDI